MWEKEQWVGEGKKKGKERRRVKWIKRSYKGRQTTTDLRVLTKLFVIKDSILLAQYYLT